MRESDLALECDLTVTADSPGGSGPLTDAIYREDCRVLPPTGKECARCVGEVVVPVRDGACVGELALKQLVETKFGGEPARHASSELLE